MKKFFVIKRIRRAFFPRLGRRHYLQHKESARILVGQKIEYFQTSYNFSVGKVAIRNQKTRWGSCSKKGNLNFNYKIALIPERLADYIIFHELCHLKEFNHSANFWALVAQEIPDYRARKEELKKCTISIS
ncbi:MAG: M48 family metallopeptidase [Candidatus Paceibacterota bacterium]|jgi:hypothetical protein